jgi:dihydroflavonol-4-reductase
MKTLVAGTTGFIGASLVRELIADGRDVRVLVRPNADLLNIDGLNVEVVHGDLRELSLPQNSVEHALEDAVR